MKINNFSQLTSGIFSEWLIRNYREFYSKSEDVDYSAFDLRSYGIPIENSPVDKLSQLFSFLDSDAQKKVFEKSLIGTLCKVQPDVSIPEYGFSPEAMTAVIAVIGRIKSIDALEVVINLAIKGDWNEYCPSIFYNILTALWEFGDIDDKSRLSDLFYKLTDGISSKDKFILFNVFTMSAALFPDKFEDIVCRFIEMLQDLENESLNDSSDEYNQRFKKLCTLLYDRGKMNEQSYNKLIETNKPIHNFIMITILNKLLRRNNLTLDAKILNDISEILKRYEKYECDKLIIFDVFELVIKQFPLEIIADSFEIYGYILEDLKNRYEYPKRLQGIQRHLLFMGYCKELHELGCDLASIKRYINMKRNELIGTNRFIPELETALSKIIAIYEGIFPTIEIPFNSNSSSEAYAR